MKKHQLIGVILILTVIQMSCIIFSPKPAAEPVPATATPSATAAETAPAKLPTATHTIAAQSTQTIQAAPSDLPEDDCVVNIKKEVTIYNRPSKESAVFSSQYSGPVINVHGRTEDGWIGFDPGVMQAGNAGVFRLRWIPPDSEMEFSGNCDDLPVLWGPPPGVCFAMIMTDTKIYQSPNEDSPVITNVAYGDCAEAIGRIDDNWIKLNLGVGNMGINAYGWGNLYYISYNGNCADLPTVDQEN